MADIYTEDVFEKDDYYLRNKKREIAEAKASLTPTNLENKLYQRLVTDYIQCSTKFVDSFWQADILKR